MRIAFVTCAALPDGADDDHEVAALIDADYRVWDDPGVDWTAYDRVVIRSAWDYSARRKEFVAWAHAVGADRLVNTPGLVELNSDKTYLADLAALGVPIVPTIFVRPGDPLPELDGEVVVKPTVSAGAVATGRFAPELHDQARDLVRELQAAGRTAMVQPYLAGVDTRGETALVFLGGELSHVLHKKPVLRTAGLAPLADIDGHAVAAAMFDPDLVTPGSADEAQVALARRVVAGLTEQFGPLAYVRVDLVPGGDGSPVVIEVEAVEPCLYLATAPGSSRRFAQVLRG